MEELKPCPFCGGEAELVIKGGFMRIVCSNCIVSMTGTSYVHGADDELIKAWNTRKEEERLQTRIEDLEECNDKMRRFID